MPIFRRKPSNSGESRNAIPPEFADNVQQMNAALKSFYDIGDPGMLDTALMAFQHIRSHANWPHADRTFRASTLDSAGGALLKRYLLAGQRADLEQAIRFWEQDLELALPASLDQAALLHNLAVGLLHRYEYTRSIEDLNRAIWLARQASALAPPESREYALCLNTMGSALLAKYRFDSELSTLNEAIQCSINAGRLTSPDSPDAAWRLSDLSLLLQERFRLTDHREDLNQAILLAERAVEKSTAQAASYALRLNNLAKALLMRYDFLPNLSDLDRAIDIWRSALDAINPTSPDRAMLLGNLASGLQSRFEHTSHIRDLDEAIAGYQQALDLTASDAEEARASLLNRLGRALFHRYETSNELTYLSQSVDYHRRAVKATPESATKWLERTASLADVLCAHYIMSGNIDDLTEANQLYQTAIAKSQTNLPMTWHGWSTLYAGQGRVLSDLYDATGSLEALNQAAAACSKALEFSLTAANKAALLNNLSGICLNQYRHSANRADLDKALDFAQQSLDLTSLTSPDRANRQANLGTCLLSRYEATEDISELDHAIELIQEALEATNADIAGRPAILNGLATALRQRYLLNGATCATDLDRAIDLTETAIGLTPETSPDLASRVFNLAQYLSDRSEKSGIDGDRHEGDQRKAATSYERACQIGLDSSPQIALASGRAWGFRAAQRNAWQESAQAYTYALHAVDTLFHRQRGRDTQEVWLRDWQGLASQAAYAFSKVGDHASAALALEINCSRLLFEATRGVHYKRLLEDRYPELAQRYKQAIHQSAVVANAMPSDSHSQASTQYAKLRESFDEVVEIMRDIGVTGIWDEFPELSNTQQLVTDLNEDEALVYLTPSHLGSLALIARRQAAGESAQIETVLFESFCDLDLHQMLVVFEDGRARRGYIPALYNTAILQTTLEVLLPDIGRKLIGPLADRLRELRVRHAIIVPGGLLSILPLHACPYSISDKTSCLLDEFEVTYAPAARTFQFSRQYLKSRSTRGEMLIGVGNPLPVADPLPHTYVELQTIADLFPGEKRLLLENEANKRSLLELLSDATYIHLASHGLFDPQLPQRSHLLLAKGERLTVHEIMESEHLKRARLVVLSACQTAVSDFQKLPDEAIGLFAGFIEAGALGVVGTLWAVNDLSTMLLMVKFYEAHLREGLAPAAALRQAQLWLHAVTNAELSEVLAQYKSNPLLHTHFREFTLRAPNEKPYAHPYYWAPFVFYGV